ncbi:hypothetical protein MYP_3895 [Sporocytophaga myxococcoides]|uniref:Uncharacterized protein n=1 Tax=Sporocytophaga myxococcoides TaxID=153721 RepID=A0A098LI66_9BACT|nr:hypothetical protein MYP_3895 [Sporocytophaga myxococcoides]
MGLCFLLYVRRINLEFSITEFHRVKVKMHNNNMEALIDLSKHLYDTSIEEVRLVEVPDFNYLTLYGEGPAQLDMHFLQAALTLFKVDEYAKKILSARTPMINICTNEITPIEVLWWKDDRPFDFNLDTRWKWAIMINEPAIVNKDVLNISKEMVLAENPDWSFTQSIALSHLSEGLSLQTSFKGDRAEGKKSLEKVHDFAKSKNLEFVGKYHEIYFEKPEGLRSTQLVTILRFPVSEIKISQII